MKIFLLAASIRALAMSVSRSGLRCSGADFFADWDTRLHCDVRKIDSYEEVLGMLKTAACDHLVYGGPLENHTGLLESIREQIDVMGCQPSAVGRLRCPFEVARVLTRNGLPALPVSSSAGVIRGLNVEKPLASAGGAGVRLVQSGSMDFIKPKHFFQQHAPGRSISACYAANCRGCQLIGVSRQLSIRHGSSDFLYRGSIGPLQLDQRTVKTIEQFGCTISAEFEIVGWFGIDFVLNDDGLWLLEINPRYTASMEIFERLSGEPLFGLHRDACAGWPLRPVTRLGREYLGKYVVYNHSDKEIVVDAGRFGQMVRNHGHPWVTDIPCPETAIGAGRPLCTIWADGVSLVQVRRRLAQRAAQLLRTGTIED